MTEEERMNYWYERAKKAEADLEKLIKLTTDLKVLEEFNNARRP